MEDIYSAESGRWIYKDGKPVARIALYSECQCLESNPNAANELTREIVSLLNKNANERHKDKA